LLRLEPKSLVSMLGDEKAAAFAEAMRTRSLLFELASRSQEAQASAVHAQAITDLVRIAPERT
jgi:hypothetical protein